MEELRDAAHKVAQDAEAIPIPDSILNNITVTEGLAQLWQEISSDNSEACQKLLLAQAFLKLWGQKDLSDVDKRAVNNLYDWASGLALPSSVFVESEGESISRGIKSESRRRYSLAVSVIQLLATLLPLHKTDGPTNSVIALASFTSVKDAWTTQETYETATRLLDKFVEESESSALWATVESTLKNHVKPLFAKTKNPAITAAGRKNFHPVPLPRFDMSVLDPEAKPWKTVDVYATTVFSWVINQYKATDREYLEAHFPVLIPPILTLIDDDAISFKTRGCTLLSQILIPIRDSKSDILRRTNLVSVFEDAIRPCLHSLPTITTEEDSIKLLGAAYPALSSLLRTTYGISPSPETQIPPKHQKDKDTFISATTKTLRDHLIPSFHHISSTNTTSASNFASFPFPRLSTLLLNYIAAICADLGIHTTKYLQDIIPLLYSALSNPFGTAHSPLLLSAISVARAVVLNAHPRIWRWRAEFLGAICSCWLRILEDEEDAKAGGVAQPSDADVTINIVLIRVKKELQGLVYLLRFALENPLPIEGDRGQLEAKENIVKEIQILVDADDNLRGCLLADVDPNDADYFGLSPCL